MNFQKAQRGQKFQISAEEFNAFVDAALDHRERRLAVGGGLPAEMRPPTVLVRNDSGESLNRFGILGIAEPLITPEANLLEFQNRVALSGVVPMSAEHEERFVVLAEPLSEGVIGRAFLTGVAPVWIDVSDENHTHATIRNGEVGVLESAAGGKNRILWKEAGIGTRWGYILLGGGGDVEIRWFSFSAMRADHIVCLDGGGVEVNIAKPFLLRRSPFDGSEVSRRGVTFNYADGAFRTATLNAGTEDEETETQIIIPRYLVADEIVAIRPVPTNVFITVTTPEGDVEVELKWLAFADGRAWAKKHEA